MGSLLPVSGSRTSQLMVQQRLLAQLGSDQSDLLNIETQISTGHRLTLPSDDAPAAVRALGLQGLLNQKSQVKTNLSTNQSYLSATDSALSQVSGLLTEMRGLALSSIGTLASNDQRTASADQVQQALEQLVNTGNQRFRGRSLFAGSLTSATPFQINGQAVQYNGNQGSLSSFADTNLLFKTNADGDSVFGAISAAVQGSVDLNPVLRDDTPLADLHGGQGIDRSSIAISDGNATSVVDISKAQSIGDVISLIQHQPPAGRTVTVTLTATGLNISLDAAGGGALSIKEVGDGSAAYDLGILHEIGQNVGPVIGSDLNPRITDTTSLTDLLGARAKTTIASPGNGNDIVLEALTNGPQLNGINVSFANSGAITPGQETVTYNANAKTIVVNINAGQSTAQNVVDALNNDPQVNQLFQAKISTHDPGNPLDPNSSFVDATATGTFSGGSGIQLDQQSGLQINSNGQTNVIDISQAKTVQDLLNKINSSPAGALAEINAQGTGINVRSRTSGVDFSVGENGGATATQLGVRSFTTTTQLADLNYGAGVHPIGGAADFIIQRKDGIDLKIDLSSAKTIGDVINLINNDPINQDSDHSVTAQLSKFGNGIELTTTDQSAIAPLAVINNSASHAAEELGLIPVGSHTSLAAVVSGGAETISGRDVNPNEVNGAFTALIRLEKALRNNDDVGIQRAVGLLDSATTQVNLARADLGSRQQGLDTLQTNLDSEVTALTSSLSTEIDTDMATAITDLTGKQTSFQAALQVAAQTYKLTLLNYI